MIFIFQFISYNNIYNKLMLVCHQLLEYIYMLYTSYMT